MTMNMTNIANFILLSTTKHRLDHYFWFQMVPLDRQQTIVAMYDDEGQVEFRRYVDLLCTIYEMYPNRTISCFVRLHQVKRDGILSEVEYRELLAFVKNYVLPGTHFAS